MDKVLKLACDLAQKYRAKRVVIYGSRARGDNRETSDYDLAFFGVTEKNQPQISHALNWEAPTLCKVDIVFDGSITDELGKNIKKEGKTIYEAKY